MQKDIKDTSNTIETLKSISLEKFNLTVRFIFNKLLKKITEYKIAIDINIT